MVLGVRLELTKGNDPLTAYKTVAIATMRPQHFLLHYRRKVIRLHERQFVVKLIY